MSIPFHIDTYTFGNHEIKLAVPDADYIQRQYNQNKSNGIDAEFPYWAKLWPASIALCEFITANTHYIKNKTVLELAAGLALPSLLSAQHASKIIASDYLPEAVEFIKQSANENHLQNVQCNIIDWNSIDESIAADVLLLSDINYAPVAFDQLFEVIKSFLQKGCTILLSTPQRLSAKSFIERLSNWRVAEEEIAVLYNNEKIYTTVWILKES